MEVFRLIVVLGVVLMLIQELDKLIA